MRALLATSAAIAGLALVACGDDEEDTTAPADTGAREPVATVDVTEVDFAIQPEEADVAETGLVEFNVANEGETAHSLAIESDPEAVSDTIQPGQSTTFTAELEPGEYRWYCPIADHEQLGMVGTLTVGGGSAGGETESDDSGASGGGAPSY